jgi:hypothetical protein
VAGTRPRQVVRALRRRSRRFKIALGAALAGCAPAQEVDPAPSPAAPPEEEAQEVFELEAQLSELGYVDYGADPTGGGDGVVLHDPRSEPGYGLYVDIPHSAAILIDADGREVHRWQETDSIRWTRAKLAANGDVLVIGVEASESARVDRFVTRLDAAGRVVFRKSIAAHHDLDVLPDGRLLVPVQTARSIELDGAPYATLDDELTLLGAEGEVLSRFSTFEAMQASPEVFAPRGAAELAATEESAFGYFHTNAAQWIRWEDAATEEPLYRPGDVLVTWRRWNTIAIVSLAERRLRFAWGDGELQVPHEARLLENGHILVFDNGTEERGYSRIVELDPRARAIVWEYVAPRPEEFFSATRGTVQVLPGGNLLVSNTNVGEAFELTRGKEIVWRFLNPSRRNEHERAVLRMLRYPVEQVAPLLTAEEDER